MEIVEVHFALCLEPMHVLEKTKGKDGARVGPGGGNPFVAKELDPPVPRWSQTVIVTITIFDPNLLSARYVEKCEVDGRRGDATRATDAVADLIERAQVEECLFFEELPVPFLRGLILAAWK